MSEQITYVKDPVDLSIIIVNWNTRDLLAQCLQLVYDTTNNLSFEIIVVDNASSDGSQEMVRQEFPDVNLIVNTENLGFAKANNQAVRRSQGRYVLLLNSDTFVRENTIEQMVAFMDAHPGAGAAGCRLYYSDGQPQLSCSSFPTLSTEFCLATSLDKLFPHSLLFGRYRMTYWDFNDVHEVDVVLGAFIIIRRQAIEQVGFLDETFFMYSEEVDWCYRIKKSGWKIYYVPYVEATHIWGGSVKRIKAEMLVEMYRSRIAFFQKHYGWISVLGLKSILVGTCISRLVFLPVRYVLGGSLSKETRQKFYGYWRLFKALPSL